ncbi:unnamed protein product [Meloidogyne enterolobii]|uniref:Uncharacterized protein n=1 Tax=Meloidogyne enterolobii TaxID=390850 RepID=A0ACB1A922_MELEN
MKIRLKLTELQKSRKRRIPIDESSKFNQEQQQSEPYCTTSEIDTENGKNSGKELIKFEQGITNKGEVAIWNAGYRYIKHGKNGEYWRCSTKDCSARAKATQNETGLFVGTLGTNEYNHLPSIQKKISQEIRNKLKHDKRPNKRPILSEVRANVSDEVYMSLGSDHALEEFLRRYCFQKLIFLNLQT